MSDIDEGRQSDQNPAAGEPAAESGAPAAEPATPAAESAAPPAPPAPPAPQQPAWQPPAGGAQHPGAPYGAQQGQYGRPAQPGHPGQPATGALGRPPHPQAYAGQPYSGQGPHPGRPSYPAYPLGHASNPGTSSNPTVPLGPSGGASGTTPTGATKTTRPEKKSAGRTVAAAVVAAALVGGAAGIGGAWAGVNWFAQSPTVAASGPSTVTVNDPDSVNQTTAIAAKVVPSVVTISATSSAGGGTGSGVIISEDGYVITNTHVVTLDGATNDADIRVTTSEGRVYDAEVVGTDPTYDLAVIKLQDASGLTPIEFADSSKLNVGDETVAVGAPLGLSNTVTTGIVSALNRSIQIASAAVPELEGDDDSGRPTPRDGEGPFQFDFGQGPRQNTPSATISIAVIQTDAAINPGNSGGALVDSEGKLIGINVAIATAGGAQTEGSGSIGVGFAIPSDIAKRVADEIIENGEATHGLLGASVQSAAFVEGSTITGAYIAEIVPGGAADEAGLRVGDIVTEFNGVPITDSVDLTAQVRAAAGGSDATLTYVRDGESHTIDVTLGTLEP
jgi:putative serine protease PepD